MNRLALSVSLSALALAGCATTAPLAEAPLAPPPMAEAPAAPVSAGPTAAEADAFVVASLTMVPLVPRLVFLVVGPAFDVKLAAMQAGMFGRAFALRFGPATLVVASVIATGVGLAILGGGS